MARSATARAPGRPKDQEKRDAIIEAAESLFLKGGFDGVTMEQVAALAGVAKMTVYGHFGDKETLFEAMVRSTSDGMIAVLGTLPPAEGELADVLVAFGRTFLTMLLSPDVVGRFHHLFDALSRNRRLAARFYDAGPGRMQRTLADFLTNAADRGDLAFDSATEAAADLFSLWVGDMPQILALGLADPITLAQIEQRARRGTHVFLRAYAAGPSGRSDGMP
jgi:TetR/AcrR family transcriptional repressor of mexJK operon